MNITDYLVNEIWEFAELDIPDRIIHQIKRCLVDYLGVTYAGAAQEVQFQNRLRTEADGACSLIGLDRKADVHSAAMVNGFTSHVMELDDGHRFGMLHLGAPVFSAMIAVAQHENISLERFVKGVLVGYETTIRLAMAIQPAHKQRGYHGTGTCGTIGVACAVAIALGCSKEELKSSIAAAATSASGLLEVIDDSSQYKPYNVAHASANGVDAAYMGMLGFQGPDDVIGGKRGFFQVLTGSYKPEVLAFPREGERYSIENIYVKPYAACRHCHSAIEGALKIAKKENLNPDDISDIQVDTYKLAVFGHDHTNITGVSSAKMSTPYGVAAAVILRDAGADAFSDEMVKRNDILSLCKKVKVKESEELTALSPAKRGATVTITVSGGHSFTERVEYPLGEPENNVADQELEEKSRSLMRISKMPEQNIEMVLDAAWKLENKYPELLSLI